jgi:hypothetical protein
VTVFTGLHGSVDPAALRGALRRLHDVDPTARALCRLVGDPASWTPVPAVDLDRWLDRLVVDERSRPAEDPVEVAQRLLRQPSDDAPYLITVGQGYLGWRLDHRFGDATDAQRLARAILCAAADGSVPDQLVADRAVEGERRPLAAATWHTLVRRPQAATWQTAIARLAMPHRASGRAAEPSDPGMPELTLISRSGRPGSLSALTDWRRKHVPGVPVAVLVMAAARIALERAGAVEPGADTVVMYDARRYVPAGTPVTGNFSSALRLTEPGCQDVRLVSEQIRRDVKLGLPLVSLLAATAAEAMRPARRPAARRQGQGAGAVVLSHVGSLRPLRGLPWGVADPERGLVAAAVPAAPDGITVLTNEWHRAVSAVISFDARVFSRSAVTAATAMLVDDPVALLTGSEART